MKRLPPSFQKDHRYLKFKIRSEEEFEFSDVVEELWNQIETDLGTVRASKADIWIIKNKFELGSQEGVIKVNREMEDQLITALLFLERIDGEDAFIEFVSSSGMIEKL